ncbi:MAG: hypothetical protein Q9209_001000 [Squamulea sp. 1 TL-2023]
MLSIPAAPVLQWNAQDIYIRCPYCERKHRHGTGICPTGFSGLTGHTRVSHCQTLARGICKYRLHYPFEDDSEPTSWEIDKEQGVFVTIGLPMHNSLDEDVDEDDRASISSDELPALRWNDGESSENKEPDESLEVTEQLQELSVNDHHPPELGPAKRDLSGEEVWEQEMRDPKHRLSLYVHYCLQNQPHEISSLMEKYDDDFLAATTRTGNNGIALAATEGHLRVLKWLHMQGCNINNQNCRGRTPLMIASLWGRVGVVEYLLKNGADATLRDKKRRNALDLALPSPRNNNERKRRLILHHEPPEADTHRRHIAIRLRAITGTIAQKTQPPIPERQRNTAGFFLNPPVGSQSNAVDYYVLDKRYLLPDAGKAIGRLHRGPLFHVISAMSGYSHSQWDPPAILDNLRWTNEVLKLARRLGIKVVELSYASHVEKQLMAFYVAKHVVLDDDDDKELQMVKPPGLPIEATIVVSKDVICPDCEDFIERVRAAVPMRLTIKCIKA